MNSPKVLFLGMVLGMHKLLTLAVLSLFPVIAQVALTPPGTGPGTYTVKITISSQDNMAKALIDLDQTGYALTACETHGQKVDIGGGALWQAAESAKLHLVTPHVAQLAVTQKRAKSGLQIGLTIGSEIGYDFGLAMAADVIHARPSSVAGKVLRILPQVGARKLHDFADTLDKIQPPLSSFAGDFLDPGKLYSLPAGFGMCIQLHFLAGTGGPSEYETSVSW